jgi:energy-coupling factor transporter ATP-binding protein EcfA2
MYIRRSRLFGSLLLFALLLIGSTGLVLAQSPTPASREAVVKEIKGYAERHVKNSAPMQTQTIVDLYRNNDVGLNPIQIAQLYEEEYTRQKESLKPGWGDKLRPQLGWLVAAIIALLAIFYKVLEKWLAKFIEACVEWTYNRLAGNRLLRGVTLRVYQKALIEKYEDLHIPFSTRPLKMKDVYVPLKVSGDNDTEQIDAYRSITAHQRLMILGPPGSGKSMLLKHIAFTYAEGRLTEFPGWPIPIVLELHYLSEKPEITLEQHLVEELNRNKFPKAERFIARNLELGTLMILLDGFDEVNSKEREKIVSKIKDFMDRRRECRVIITCRNAVYKGEFTDRVDQTLEIVEFSDQQIRSFLRSWEPHMPAPKSLEQLMRTLHDRPRIMALARNPLLLTIIAYLYTDTTYVLPHSRAEFYKQSTELLLRDWHQERNIYGAPDKLVVLQHLALFFQDSSEQRQQDRRSVDFQTIYEQVKLVLPKVDLKADTDVRPLLTEIVERSGLLLSIDGGQRYQFAHLTLQEYFAAAQLVNDENGLFDRFSGDHDTWRETVKLWCGLGQDSTSLIRKVYAEDDITAFECLADTQQVNQEFALEIVGAFCGRLGASDGNNEAITRAFASVASDMRPRGQAVFNFLVESLTGADKTRITAAATALSLTYLPAAAEILANMYTAAPEVRPMLVRMGDLAVDRLYNQILIGSREALDDLRIIGTPLAAHKLVPFLWAGDAKLETQAAMLLATLISRPDVEDSLKHYPLEPAHRNDSWLNFVWSPFDEPANSSLPLIAGRIAYLINENLEDIGFNYRPEIDPRLIIPLAVDAINTGKIGFTELSQWRWNVAYLRLEGESPEFHPSSLVSDTRIKDSTGLPPPLNLLEPEMQRDLVGRLIGEPVPTIDDWRNLLHPITYEFAKGWHLRAILVITALFTLTSMFGIYNYVSSPPAWNALKIILSIVYLVSVFLAWGFMGFLHTEEDGIVETILLAFVPLMLSGILARDASESKLKYMAILLLFISVTLFSPFVLYFASLFLARHLILWSIPCIWLATAALIFFLRAAGKRRERAAGNPLQGILDKTWGPFNFVQKAGRTLRAAAGSSAH